MIRRRRNLDNGLNAYYNIDSNQEFMIGGMLSGIQVKWDSNGNVLEIYQQPTGKTDAISMQHDIDYSICKDVIKCKNKADKKMVKSLDPLPFSQRQWGYALARNTISAKAKIGVGMNTRKSKSKN